MDPSAVGAGAASSVMQGSVPSMATIAGGVFVGLCVSLILFGVGLAQVYNYSLSCRSDAFLTKLIVVIILIVDALHTAFSIVMVYHYTITDFGNILAVNAINWSATAGALSTNILGVCVRIFYLWRIWLLSERNVLLVASLFTLYIVHIGFGFGSAISCVLHATWTEYQNNHITFLINVIALSLGCASDIVTAAILIYFFWNARTEFEGSHRIINVLMAYALNTGALTSMTSLLMIFTYVFLKNNLLFAGVFMVLGRLYANSVLGTLNTRQILRAHRSAPQTLQSVPHHQNRGSTGMHIQIYTEVSKLSQIADGESPLRSPDSKFEAI